MIVLSLTLLAMWLILFACFGTAGLQRLANRPLVGGHMALIAAALQIVGVTLQRYELELLSVSAGLLVITCWKNRRHAGVRIALAGIALNTCVMLANRGEMPITPAAVERLLGQHVVSGSELLRSKNRVLDDRVARLHWLGDRWLLPGPAGQLAVWSAGDFILLVGIGHFLWTTMKGYPDERHSALPTQAPCRARTADLRCNQQSAAGSSAAHGA